MKSRNLSFIFGYFFRNFPWKFVRFASQNHATSHIIHSFLTLFVGILFSNLCKLLHKRAKITQPLTDIIHFCDTFSEFPLKSVRFTLQNHATYHTTHSFLSLFVGISPEICANYYIKRQKKRNLSPKTNILAHFCSISLTEISIKKCVENRDFSSWFSAQQAENFSQHFRVCVTFLSIYISLIPNPRSSCQMHFSIRHHSLFNCHTIKGVLSYIYYYTQDTLINIHL